MKVSEIEFCPTVLWPARPDWLLQKACVDMEPLSIKHSNKTADLVQEYYSYSEHRQLFTDGSKDPLTGAAVVIQLPDWGENIRLFECVCCVVLLALEWAECVLVSKLLYSVMSSIKTGSATNHQDLVYEMLFNNSRLVYQGKHVVFMWVPAHSGIPGNGWTSWRRRRSGEEMWKLMSNFQNQREKKHSLEGNRQRVATILG